MQGETGNKACAGCIHKWVRACSSSYIGRDQLPSLKCTSCHVPTGTHTVIRTSLMHLHQLNRDQSSSVKYISCHEPMRMYKHVHWHYKALICKMNNRTALLRTLTWYCSYSRLYVQLMQTPAYIFHKFGHFITNFFQLRFVWSITVCETWNGNPKYRGVIMMYVHFSLLLMMLRSYNSRSDRYTAIAVTNPMASGSAGCRSASQLLQW